MSRHAPEIKLTEQESKKLKTIINSRSAELLQIERATIILACAEGKQSRQVAQETGFSEPTVSKWRNRFVELRFEGLEVLPDRSNLSAMAKSFAITYWLYWSKNHRKGLPAGTALSWLKNLDPVFMQSGAHCVKRAYICNVHAPGA